MLLKLRLNMVVTFKFSLICLVTVTVKQETVLVLAESGA